MRRRPQAVGGVAPATLRCGARGVGVAPNAPLLPPQPLAVVAVGVVAGWRAAAYSALVASVVVSVVVSVSSTQGS